MNTLTLTTPRSLFTRFLWKEYRMLRGFWLAGFAIAFLIQWFFSTVNLHTGNLSHILFFVAWGAAALYSVGAAITLFAAETEERTRDYLRLLPGDWKPMFASKVALAATSTLLLGLALSLTGAWLEGWPTSREAEVVLGVAGVAAIEGLCWGLLFSLWWRQPLLAAVAAMACGSLGEQLAISFGNSQDSWTAQAYANAAPARLLICLGVFAGAVLLGRRWFYPQAPALDLPNILDKASTSAVGLQVKTRLPRTKMFSRLLWQTWRESWKSMIVGLVLGMILTFLCMIPLDFIPAIRDGWMLASLIPVALTGALVFRADQQRDHRLFVATHAIPPRRMWLARQVVWLTMIVTLGLGINTLAWWFFDFYMQDSLSLYLRGGWGYSELFGRVFENGDSSWTQAWRFERSREFFNQSVLGTWCAVIAAYGAGQLCSMLLRQSLLAGFLAILFSIAIAGWALLMFLWQMPPLVYVLPIGIAALLATWLRTPSWVIGRNHFKHWLLSATFVIVPLTLLVLTIPGVRSWQLQIPEPQYPFLKESFGQMVGTFQAHHETREELGNELDKLYAEISWPRFADAMIEDTSWLESAITEQQYESYQLTIGEELPEAERKLMERFEAAQNSLRAERNQEVIKKIMALTERPSFSQVLSYQQTSNVAELLKDDAARLTAEGDLAAAWERLKALARFDNSLHYNELPYLDAILAWAQHPDQTSEQLKSAMVDLHHVFQLLPEPGDRILDDHWNARQVILEKETPSNSISPLLLLSNRLPGEQERALTAVDFLSAQALNYAAAVVYLSRGGISSTGNPRLPVDNPRELVRIAPQSAVYSIHEIAFDGKLGDFLQANRVADAAATSFLGAWQLQHWTHLNHVIWQWVEAETRRRATMLQLALLAYRIDHKEYPETLAELSPDYLPDALTLRLEDPYANKPFRYHPQGLEFPLKLSQDKYIPATTPILWSVGPSNNQLLERFEDDGNGTGQTIYSFEPTDRGGPRYESLVFKLPD